MRTEGISIPIVGIAEESATPVDRATFLESGGDDLVRCPLSVRELLASMRAVSRRARGSLSDINFFTQGESIISFDASTGQLKVNGKKVKLTFRETKLVELLSIRSPRIVSKETIQEYLYPYGEEPGLGSVEVFVTKIRRKMRDIHPDASDSIETIQGGGYRMLSE
jgi:two-component system OmpR family response regulator/two-component system response regulator QseB